MTTIDTLTELTDRADQAAPSRNTPTNGPGRHRDAVTDSAHT